MIPYFSPPMLELGPFTISTFGVLTAAGVLLGSYFIAREAERRGLPGQPIHDLLIWAIVGGVISGHLVHLFLYHPEELQRDGVLQIFKVWSGLSSMGGLIGGVLATALFFKRRNLRFAPYGDPAALGLPLGWGIARLGCFSVHDHPGRPTDFFLAVDFPPGALGSATGGPRHDLGLYEALLLFALFGILLALDRKGTLKGRLLPVLAIGYGVGRFFLDFLRAVDLAYTDTRYAGLTPAQYVALGLVVYGVVRLAKGPPDLRLERGGLVGSREGTSRTVGAARTEGGPRGPAPAMGGSRASRKKRAGKGRKD